LGISKSKVKSNKNNRIYNIKSGILNYYLF